MKRIATQMCWCAIVCAVILAGGNFLATAQRADDAPPVAKSSVAVVNIAELFKQHEYFKAQLEQMKVEVKQAEQGFQKEAEEIKELAAELKQLRPGSPLNEKLEIEVAQRTADLRVKMDLKKREFKKREAVVYAKVHNEITAEIATYSRAHSIAIVLRIGDVGDIDEAADREAILKAVNRQVVFQNDIDITAALVPLINAPAEKKDA